MYVWVKQQKELGTLTADDFASILHGQDWRCPRIHHVNTIVWRPVEGDINTWAVDQHDMS